MEKETKKKLIVGGVLVSVGTVALLKYWRHHRHLADHSSVHEELHHIMNESANHPEAPDIYDHLDRPH